MTPTDEQVEAAKFPMPTIVVKKLEEIRHQLRVNIDIIKRDKPDPLPHILPHEIEILTDHVFDRINELELALTAAFSLAPAGTGGNSAGLGGNIDMKEAAGRDALLPPQPSAVLPGKGVGVAETLRNIDYLIDDVVADAYVRGAEGRDTETSPQSAKTLHDAIAAALVSQPHPEGEAVAWRYRYSSWGPNEWSVSTFFPEWSLHDDYKPGEVSVQPLYLHPAPHKAGADVVGLVEFTGVISKLTPDGVSAVVTLDAEVEGKRLAVINLQTVGRLKLVSSGRYYNGHPVSGTAVRGPDALLAITIEAALTSMDRRA